MRFRDGGAPEPRPSAYKDAARLVAPVLVGSPFERRERWGSAVVVLRCEEKRVTSRGDFAGWLAANDLRAAARECTSRRVPPGHVLVWIEVDTDEVAVARFVVLDVAGAMRAKRDREVAPAYGACPARLARF